MLAEAARDDLLLKLPKGENLGAALNKAMKAMWFRRHIGVDYSGPQTLTASLKGLRVFYD